MRNKANPGDDLNALVERMCDTSSPHSKLSTFFFPQGLEQDLAPGKWPAKRTRVNAAFEEARRQGRLKEVVAEAWKVFGPDSERKAPQLRAGAHARKAADTTRRGRARTSRRPGRIFVSHASVDQGLADQLVDLLVGGAELQREKIVCATLDGLGIPIGEANFVEYLRKNLASASLVVQLLTPAFFESKFCLCELGAQWALEIDPFPFVISSQTSIDSFRLLQNMQTAELTNLNRLYDKVRKLFGLQPPTDRWEAKRDQFLKRVRPMLKRLESATSVPAATHKRTLAELAACRKELDQLKAKADIPRRRSIVEP